MRDLSVTFNYTLKKSTDVLTHDLDLDGSQDMDAIREAIAEAINDDMNGDGPAMADDVKAEDIEITGVTSSEDITEKYLTIENIFKFAEAFCECEQEADVVCAALECDIQGSDIDEAYQGSYKDDEDFAQETAESIGAIDKNAKWPQTCIDWEHAARELMYDYSSDNGHYFRNF